MMLVQNMVMDYDLFTGDAILMHSHPNHNKFPFHLTALLLCAVLIAHSTLDSALTWFPIPQTAQHTAATAGAVQPVESFTDFIHDVTNGDKNALVGVYVPFTLSLPVVDQPADQPTWIADKDGVVTRFSLADEAGSIGLLAHYEHAGKSFYQLKTGQAIQLIYGDGGVTTYAIKDIRYYQASEPSKATTSFIDLNTEAELSQEDVFNQIYKAEGRLVLQTCLVGKGSQTWGRMFVIAEISK
jgi:hypothetical protein